MNKQVAKQCCGTEQQHDHGNPVGALLNTNNCGSLGDGSFAMAFGQSESGIAFASGVSWLGRDKNFVDSHSAEVVASNSSSLQTAGSWCCPSSEVSGFGNYGEGKSGSELNHAEPTDLDGIEWVMNSDTFGGENDLRANYEQPENGCEGSCVHQANDGILESSGNVETDGGKDSNQEKKTEVNPGSSGSVDVSLGHVTHVTPENFRNMSYLLAKKGN